MNKLLRYLAFVLMVGNASAQSSLPACQGSDASKWTNCFGPFVFASGNQYAGQWKDSRRSGQGTEVFANGNKYVGEFKNDKPNGQGTLYATNGSVINQGMWTDGNFVGLSPNEQSNVPACQGSDAVMWSNCFGTYTYTNGNKYVGEFKEGKANGQGTLMFANGDNWVGGVSVGWE